LDSDLRLSPIINRSVPSLGDHFWCPGPLRHRSKTHRGFVPNPETLPSFGRIETTPAESSNGAPHHPAAAVIPIRL
jgi:hypothetical protein